jgi:hypothetical protein
MRSFTKQVSVLLAGLALALVFGLSAPIAQAQGNPNTQGQSTLTHVGGVYVARNYSFWSMQINNPNSVPAASPASFILRQGSFTMPDGRVMIPFVGEIVNIGAGTTQELVTLTAVSGCFQNAPVDSCSISGNTVNAHGRGDQITSGTNGIGEALGDAANNGGGSVYWEVDCGVGTVISGGATTTIATCKAPQAFTNFGSSVFVNTTVTTATSYSVGIVGAATAFVTSCTALTAGTNCSQFVSAPGKTAIGSGFASVLITPSTTPGAGAIHVKVWGWTAAQSNF